MQSFQLGPFSFLPSLVVLTSPPEMEDFEAPLEAIVFLQKNVFWWIGDLILEAEKKYGDDVWQLVPNNVSQDMLDRCRAIALAYPRTERHLNLSWTHHMVVANLPPEQRKGLLLQAESQGWTSGELRERSSRKRRSRSSFSEEDSFAG
jgi:hypothetical protein